MNNQNRSSNVVNFSNVQPIKPLRRTEKPSFYIENLLGLDHHHHNDQSPSRNTSFTVSSLLSSGSKVSPTYPHVQTIRSRPLFTVEQNDRLEKYYFANQSTTEQDEQTFRATLGLTYDQVKSWLLYRREKQRFMDRIVNSVDQQPTTRNVLKPMQQNVSPLIGGQWPVKCNNVKDEKQFVQGDNQTNQVISIKARSKWNPHHPGNKLTDQQTIVLEKHFAKEKYPSNNQIETISGSLGLYEGSVKYWFLKRRRKLGVQSNNNLSPDIQKIPSEAPKEQKIIDGKVNAKIWHIPKTI